MTDSFGLAPVNAEQRREKLERAYHRGFVVTLALLSLLGAGLIGYHSKAPAKPMFIASGAVVRTCQIDHRENCLVCSFTDAEGRVKHKSAHCPALAPSGTMAFPLARK